MQKVEKLLKELMLIPSPSGNEGVVGEFISNMLVKEGFEIEKNVVDDTRFNIIARIGDPKVYLSAHIDTVKTQLPYKETSTHILGRGSCDTKGSVASMIVAAIESKKQGLKNFGLIFTVGEEVDLIGARTIVKSGFNLPFVVVGEPTSLEIVNGHYGILIIKVSVKGKAAHSSMPEKGINAIDILVDLIKKTRTLKLGKGTLMSVVQINGGIADNIIPSEANAILSFRVSPNDTTDYLAKVKLFSDKSTKVEVVQEVKAIYCKVPPELAFIKKIKTVKYLTELSFFKTGVVLGPGDIKYAHGLEEKVPRKELEKAVKIYERIIGNYSK